MHEERLVSFVNIIGSKTGDAFLRSLTYNKNSGPRGDPVVHCILQNNIHFCDFHQPGCIAFSSKGNS